MKRGEIKWVDKITIVRDGESRLPKVTVEGLWSGKDRRMIGRALLKQMRKAANTIIQMHKRADSINREEEDKKLELTKKRIDALAKARAAKKEKKLKEEEKKNVRGQQKHKK